MQTMTVVYSLTAVMLAQGPAWVDPAPHRTQLVTVAEGVQLEVLDFGGTGRPIVLLAGLGNTAHVFDGLGPKLTRLGRVYAITRRGYGISSRPDAGYDVARLARDVVAVIDTLRLERPVLIGHSIAGQELSALATEHRDRIAGLVYLEAAYRYAFDLPGAFEEAFATLPPPPATPPAVVRQPHTLPEAERHQPPGSVVASQAIRTGGRQFVHISLPTLAIFASPHDVGSEVPDPDFERFDTAVTELQALVFERGVPGARVVRWPRVSHYVFLAREADVIDEVGKLIRTLP